MAAFSKTHQPDKVLLVGADGMPWQEFIKISPNELL